MIKKTGSEITKGFMEQFTEIKKVTVKLVEQGQNIYDDGKRIYTEENLRELIKCSNTLCYKGGFSIGSILRRMYHKKEKHWEGFKICQGNEASKKGRVIYRKCVNNWDIEVDIEYK